jgi:hypothetical protein
MTRQLTGKPQEWAQSQAIWEPLEARDVSEAVVFLASEQLHEEPTTVKYLPKLGVVFVRGTARLIRCFLEQDDVVAASANDGMLSTQ